MLIACIFRNVSDNCTTFGELPKEEMDALGDAARNVFLGIALMSLELWELVNLAVPMLIILLLQVVLAYVFANFICFPLMGKDYDAAMISCGLIGFGMGSTSNAIANMDAVSAKYAYSKTPLLCGPHRRRSVHRFHQYLYHLWLHRIPTIKNVQIQFSPVYAKPVYDRLRSSHQTQEPGAIRAGLLCFLILMVK